MSGQSKKFFFLGFTAILGLLLSGCSFAWPSSSSSSTPSVTGGVYKSADRGLVWEAKNDFLGLGRVKLNVKKISFAVDSSATLYAATNLGFFVTRDAGTQWQNLIPQYDIADFALNPKTKTIIYVASGNQVFKTADAGEKWDLVYTEVRPNVTIKSLAVDYFDTSRVYLLENDGILLVSLDWGNSWKALYNFEKPALRLLVDQYHYKHLYVAGADGLYHSADNGGSWREIVNSHLGDYPGINTFKDLFFINKEGSLLYLSRYGLLRSADGGANWSPLSLVSPPNSVDIEVLNYNPKDPNEIYYVLNDILYHTYDGGRNWQTQTLPASGKFKASGLLVDPRDPSVLYLSLTQ